MSCITRCRDVGCMPAMGGLHPQLRLDRGRAGCFIDLRSCGAVRGGIWIVESASSIVASE